VQTAGAPGTGKKLIFCEYGQKASHKYCFQRTDIETAEGRKYLSEWGYADSYEAAKAKGHVDLSEVGVVEARKMWNRH